MCGKKGKAIPSSDMGLKSSSVCSILTSEMAPTAAVSLVIPNTIQFFGNKFYHLG